MPFCIVDVDTVRTSVLPRRVFADCIDAYLDAYLDVIHTFLLSLALQVTVHLKGGSLVFRIIYGEF